LTLALSLTRIPTQITQPPLRPNEAESKIKSEWKAVEPYLFTIVAVKTARIVLRDIGVQEKTRIEKLSRVPIQVPVPALERNSLQAASSLIPMFLLVRWMVL
jgi:hypothetical protein